MSLDMSESLERLKLHLEQQRDAYQLPEPHEIELLAREYNVTIAKARTVYAEVVNKLLTSTQQLSADVAGQSVANYWNQSDAAPKKP